MPTDPPGSIPLPDIFDVKTRWWFSLCSALMAGRTEVNALAADDSSGLQWFYLATNVNAFANAEGFLPAS